MTNSLNGLGLLLILTAVVAVYANYVREGRQS
jgi:hypothetical protein